MTFDVLCTIVFLNVMATIALWRAVGRKPPKPKKDFISKLLDDKPIVPEHLPPKIIGENFSSLVTDGDRQFFEDFIDFGVVVNWWLADEHVGGPWRLQELAKTDLGLPRLYIRDEPAFGRRYAIFHNQIRLGTLEVSSSPLYSSEKRDVTARIELDSVWLLAFGSIAGFLKGIAMHVGNPAPNSMECMQTDINTVEVLMGSLWHSNRASEDKMNGQG
jgi:hypothetical protein